MGQKGRRRRGGEGWRGKGGRTDQIGAEHSSEQLFTYGDSSPHIGGREGAVQKEADHRGLVLSDRR